MDKFYRVKSDSALYKDYFAWLESVPKTAQLFRAFAEANGIEAHYFTATKEQLGIVPTENDLLRFSSQLRAQVNDFGVRYFKRNSQLGKAWTTLAGPATIPLRPALWMYVKSVGRLKGQLVNYHDELYVSFEADDLELYSFEAPEETFEEIKGSLFWEMLEKADEEEKAKKNN